MVFLSNTSIQQMEPKALVARLKQCTPIPGSIQAAIIPLDRVETHLLKTIAGAEKERHSQIHDMLRQLGDYSLGQGGLAREAHHILGFLYAEFHHRAGHLEQFKKEKETELSLLHARQEAAHHKATQEDPDAAPLTLVTPQEMLLHHQLAAASRMLKDYGSMRTHDLALAELPVAGQRMLNVACIGQSEVGFSYDYRPLGTRALFDCITIILWDPSTGHTGMAHADKDIALISLQRHLVDQFPKGAELRAALVGARHQSSGAPEDNLLKAANLLKANPHISLDAVHVWDHSVESFVFLPRRQQIIQALPVDLHPDAAMHDFLPSYKSIWLRKACQLSPAHPAREAFFLTKEDTNDLREFKREIEDYKMLAADDGHDRFPYIRAFNGSIACHNSNVRASAAIVAEIVKIRKEAGLAPIAENEIGEIIYDHPKVVGAYAESNNTHIAKDLAPKMEELHARRYGRGADSWQAAFTALSVNARPKNGPSSLLHKAEAAPRNAPLHGHAAGGMSMRG